MSKLTDYEVGNFAINNVAPKLTELASDCKESHPTHARYLSRIGLALNIYGDELEGMPENGKEADGALQRLKGMIENESK